jgi:hypothetical protein
MEPERSGSSAQRPLGLSSRVAFCYPPGFACGEFPTAAAGKSSRHQCPRRQTGLEKETPVACTFEGCQNDAGRLTAHIGGGWRAKLEYPYIGLGKLERLVFS